MMCKKVTTENKSLKTFSSYSSYLFSHSSMTGIPPIIESKGCFQKIVKIFILLFSVAGFLFQTHQFLQIYWKYFTVISIKKADTMMRPATTFCDHNRLRRSFICKVRPDVCKFENNEQKDCSQNAEFCKDSKIIEILRVYPDEFFDWNVTKTGGSQLQDSLLSCKWDNDVDSKSKSNEGTSMDCGPTKFVRALDSYKFPYACYTLNTYTDEKNYVSEHFKHNTGQMMIMKWIPGEYLYTNAIAYVMSFHDPQLQVNPIFPPRYLYHALRHVKVQVHQETIIRLPPPYDTRCHDYRKYWNKNGGKGPLNKEECLANCDINLHLDVYGCVSKEVMLPHKEKICPRPFAQDTHFTTKVEACKEICADACMEIKYVDTSEIINQILINETYIEKYGEVLVSFIDIEFSVLESKIISHKPKYERVELLSYIGGYLGMWLGWSLIAIFDFFGTLFKLCCYPWLKRRGNKKIFTLRKINYYQC